MTKFILHGGRTHIRSTNNELFFKEILKDLDSPISILLVYFATPQEKWNNLYDEDTSRFQEISEGRTLQFTIARPELISDQIPLHTVIYIRGGDCELVREKLKPIKNLQQLLQNKVVAGSSAGAYVLSQYYFCNDSKKIEHGLGILPIKTFCHYTKEQDGLLHVLSTYREKLKTFPIPEELFVIYNKSL